MKKRVRNQTKLPAILLIFIALQLLNSCTKSEVKEEVTPENMTELVISITGIEEEDAPPEEVSVKSASRTSSSTTKNQVTPVIKNYGDFDAMVSVEDDHYEGSDLSTPSVFAKKASRGGNKAATVPLVTNIRYRILLYRPNGTLFATYETASGTTLNIPVIRGDTYNWIAYSFNDNATVANVADVNNPSIPTGENRDVLRASGTITVSAAGNTPLGIIFKHRLNRMAVELNSMGMFADINSASITLGGNYFRTGTLNLRTGAITNLQPYAGIPTNVTTFQAPTGYTFNDRKVLYYYTADSTARTGFQVTVNNLSIKLDDNSNRVFSTAATFTMNLSASATLGRSRVARIDLVESPLTAGGIRWARANLYLNSSGHNAYRFYHNNTASQARESFWPWRGITPTSNVGTGDPCKSVYPVNLWRTPTSNEYQLLMNTNSQTFSSAAIQYTSTGTLSPYNTNQLLFRMNGFGSAVNIANLIQLSLGMNEVGNQAHYWSDNQSLDLIVAGLGVTFYRARNQTIGIVFPSLVQDASNQTTLIGDIGLLGLTILSSGYRNIRCVRN